MTKIYSLAYLTLKDLPPDQAVEVSAEAGYQMVGLRFLPAGSEAPFPILTDKALQQRVKQALKSTGTKLADIEIVRINDQFDLERFKGFLELGAELGAKHVLTAGDDKERERLISHYGAFCELAASFGMSADLEGMPWTAVNTVKENLAIVEAVNQPNAAVLIDALHFDRSDSSLDDLKLIPASRINYIQVCDANKIENPTLEQLIHTARDERMLPGDGEIDLRAMLAALPQDKVISVEIPRSEAEKTLSPLHRAKEALERTKALFETP